MASEVENDLKRLSSFVNDFDAFLSYCEVLESQYTVEEFQTVISSKDIPNFDAEETDLVANKLLSGIVDDARALKSSPDGNCLFNSASKLIVNNYSLSTELRLRTCIELAINIEFYSRHPDVKKLQIKTKNGTKNQSIEAIYDVTAFSNDASNVFEKGGFIHAMQSEIGQTSISKNFCGILQIMGLATVIGKPIQLYYPNKKNTFFLAFENTYNPRLSHSSFHAEPFVLFWTNTNGWEDKDTVFRANHFVPLIPLNKSYVELISNPNTDNLSLKTYYSPIVANKNCNGELPFSTMSKDWYAKIGKNESSNRKRDCNRSLEDGSKYRVEYKSLEKAIENIEALISNQSNSQKKRNLTAILKSAQYIHNNAPLVRTQDVIKIYRQDKGLDNKRMTSISMYEILKNHLPVSNVLIKGVSYIVEGQFENIVKKMCEFHDNNLAHEDVTDHITKSIGNYYKNALQYLDTKRDRDVLKGLISKITSIRFATKLERRKSRLSHRNSYCMLEGNLMKYEEIKQTSLTVRNDMTVQQQAQLHSRISSKRKMEEMKSVAKGRGASLKVNQFPELPVILEGIFGENGLESHPRLTDEVLYRTKSSALTMKRARELLLALSPRSFNISLSCCYNYTQNYKAGTAQAKRHHEGKNINACISLHAPPRIGVEHISPNLHWSTANVNNIIDISDYSDSIIDSKDAKCIVCADIAPVQRPGKTWKKRSGALLDHEWNQSRTNAVTPMTHLLLQPKINNSNFIRTGKGVTLINLSMFEPSSSFRCMNEFFKMLLHPSLYEYFRNESTKKLKKQLIFIVDNGPAESPSSVLVQMLLIRMRKFLNLDSAIQISFAEYHSKRNFVERVHSKENEILSRHGPFSSKLRHKNVINLSDQHRENMEAMAKEVVDCLQETTYGGLPLTSFRGVKDDEYIFDDEKSMKEFLALSEGKKRDYKGNYSAKRNEVCEELHRVWGINENFKGNYYEDYLELQNVTKTWRDKYTIINVKNSIAEIPSHQPIPDYLRWAENGELHYLPIDKIKRLDIRVWNDIPALFLPTGILNMVFDSGILSFSPSESLFMAISFLAWLPVKEVKEYFDHMHKMMEDEYKKDRLRDQLSQLNLYKKSKDDLIKICRQRNLDITGTKLDLGLRLANNMSITLKENPEYCGDISTIPNTTSELRSLGIAGLRSILKFNNVSYRGSKDNLVLKVALIKAKKRHLIHQEERSAILKLITSVKRLIYDQRTLNHVQVTPKKRKFETPNHEELTDKNPRCMASAFEVYTKSVIKVPSHIQDNNMEDILIPLEVEIMALNTPDVDDTHNQPSGSITREIVCSTDYEKYFEIGVKLQIRWNKEDVGESGWRPGWFTAEVQDSDLHNDWVKVEYLSEPGSIYKMEVSANVNNETMKLKSVLF